MKKLIHFAYYGEDNKDLNLPNQYKINADILINGKLFQKYRPIYQIGIQGPNGLEFKLNGGLNSLYLNEAGIYELDLGNLGYINKIQFSDLARINKNTPLLIDIIYEGR